jgi:membrane associated rhomboid family serine protease
MILLVPISPEVPKVHRPRLWPALIMVLTMGLIYLRVYDIIQKDTLYVENISQMLESDPRLSPDAYLKTRPLLKVAPAKADWNVKRLILANFIHGNTVHLLLNLVGVFAGVRICTTFLPFLATVAIFLLGGSLGLATSLFITEQFSPYIPHVGASAGIFALMGTYYVYNFRFRTTYFFWFPTRRGLISLRTSWFFFMDVLLLELVLSTAQLFPERLDSVDHIAHVSGFLSGALLAVVLRALQKWPSFLQTRGEFLYWTQLLRPKILQSPVGQQGSQVVRAYMGWIELLNMNRYNDQLKLRICAILRKHPGKFSNSEIAEGLKFLNPTFIRLHPAEMGECIRSLLKNDKPLPQRWLQRTPYDTLIRIAKQLTHPVEEQMLLYKLFVDYRKAQPNRPEVEKKLKDLITKLHGILGTEEEVTPLSESPDETNDNENEEDNQNQEEEDSKEKTAKVAF